MDSSKPSLRRWFPGMHLLVQSKTSLSALQLIRHLRVSYPAAWRIKHKLMQTMAKDEAGRKLGGIVQLDGAYLGRECNGGHAQRGSKKKRPFVIALETTEDGRPRHVAIDPAPGFTTRPCRTGSGSACIRERMSTAMGWVRSELWKPSMRTR